MKRRIFFIALLAFVTSFIFNSCNKTDDDNFIEANGLSVDINSFMPQSILDKIDSLGFPIHTGGTPSDVTGTFLISPEILYSSNIEDDEIGKTYADLTLSFSSQENRTLTIQMKQSQLSIEGKANSSFIVGENDNFSVFSQIKMHDSEKKDSCLLAQIYSGTITEEGIENCFGCIVMLNDYGDPNDQYIEIGDARVFYDEDGLSENSDKLKTSKVPIGVVSNFENNQMKKRRK